MIAPLYVTVCGEPLVRWSNPAHAQPSLTGSAFTA